MELLKQDRISLNEETHTYTVKGAEHLTFESCTTFIGDFFSPFEAEKIATKLAKSKKGKYKDKNKKEILDFWDEIADEGTFVHKEVEDWCHGWNNLKEVKVKKTKSKHAVLWLQDNLEGHYKLFPEVKVFSKELQLAGTIDLLIYEPNENLWVMVDWKTNSKIATTAWGNKKGTHYSTRLIPDCNFNKYALQMSLYSWLLKEEYGIDIYERYLIHLRPQQTVYYPLGVKEYKTPYMKSNIEKMVEYRLEQKKNGNLFKLRRSS